MQVNLRVLGVVSTSCSIAFNLLQPTPLVTPACWGVFFIACHAYQLAVLLRERRTTALAPRERRVFERSFEPYGFTPRQFVDVVERTRGRWPRFAAGEFIHRRGEPMDEVRRRRARSPPTRDTERSLLSREREGSSSRSRARRRCAARRMNSLAVEISSR